MHLSKLPISLLFLAASAANAQTSVKFQGSCQSNLNGAEPQAFDVEVSPSNKLTLPIVETDGFGTKIVTNVLVSFPLSSLLAVRFSTDLHEPFGVSAFGVVDGTTLRAQFPLRLGGQVACEATVRTVTE